MFYPNKAHSELVTSSYMISMNRDDKNFRVGAREIAQDLGLWPYIYQILV